MSENNAKTNKIDPNSVLELATVHEPVPHSPVPAFGEASSAMEVSIIEFVSSFFDDNCSKQVDQDVIKSMAEAIVKRLNDTSPGTLQDVTMDNSYGVSLRSPGVNLQHQNSMSPATQGRSVREFEEQMAALRKENFNLKLRLYFIEESLPGFQQNNGSDGQDSAMKQVIETKVQMEILRKELEEKQDLLKEAAAALNQMEQLQKNDEEKYQSIIEDLKQKIYYLEMDRDMEKSNNQDFFNSVGQPDFSTNENILQKTRELKALQQQTEDRENELQQQIEMLCNEVAQKDETIKTLGEKVKKLEFQNNELLETIENREKDLNSNETKKLRHELQKHKIELANVTCMLEESNEKLENLSKIHNQALRTIQKLMNIKSQQDETNELKNYIGDNKSPSNDNLPKVAIECVELSRSQSDSEAYLSEQQALKAKITVKSLRAEIKEKTAKLQTLERKELWAKNREIVNQNSADGSRLSNTFEENDAQQLQKSATDADVTKLLQRKVNVLTQRLSVERNHEMLILQLRKDLRTAQEKLKTAEKWRLDCTNVCSMLSNRLEELAGFLNSLLKHKDVLGVLAAERRCAMRKAVDKSLDLSKNLNMTLSLSNVSLGEQSLSELSNLSLILVGGDVDIENQTFNCYEDMQVRETMQKLQEENKALKKELDKRRMGDLKKDRRSLPLLAVDNQSESEAWSEPDRNVSMARIGLDTNQQNVPTNTKETLQQLTDSDTDSEAAKQSSAPKTRTQEHTEQLERMIAQRDERLLQLQCKLVEVDNRLKKEHLRVIDLTQEVQQLRERNEELFTDLIAIGDKDSTSMKNDSSMSKNLEKKTRALEKVIEERDRILLQSRLSEMKVSALKSEIEELKRKQQQALELTAEQAKLDLEKLKNEMNVLLKQRLDEKEHNHKEELAHEWVARALYDDLREQAVELQRQQMEKQRTIDYLNANELELKENIEEHEMAVRVLKKQIDESALQASKAVLERTKAQNEKLQFEQRVEELEQNLSVKTDECEKLQQNIMQLEKQFTELKERSLRNVPSTAAQSGYTSEELAVNNVKHEKIVANAPNANRLNNSASPDLGIESDVGRLSGNEIANTQRTLLKVDQSQQHVLQIQQENKRDNEENIAPNDQEASANGNSNLPVHDCAKVDEENAELRRKLIRTKRALEDTYEKLRLANQKKAQIEKDIRNQIVKTHNVLKNVRSNMENEL